MQYFAIRVTLSTQWPQLVKSLGARNFFTIYPRIRPIIVGICCGSVVPKLSQNYVVAKMKFPAVTRVAIEGEINLE